MGGNPQLSPGHVRGDGLVEARGVHAVADDPNLLRGQAFAAQIALDGLGVRDGDLGPAVEPSPDRSLVRRFPDIDVPLRADDEGNTRKNRGQPCPRIGREQIGLHEVDPLAAHQPRQGQHEAQVDLGAFLQSKQGDAGRLDLSRHASRPEAADHRQVALAIKPLGELEELLLGTADVQLVDHEEDTRHRGHPATPPPSPGTARGAGRERATHADSYPRPSPPPDRRPRTTGKALPDHESE